MVLPRNADAGEIAKFAASAHHWWDTESPLFGPLHRLNPLRLSWIERLVGSLAGLDVLDVGCGGGILSEAMAQRGAKVLGIDLSEKALGVAKLHKLESGADVNYRIASVEEIAREMPGSADLVTCMELLEHVPDPASIVAACAQAAKPGALLAFSTLDRTPKSYLFAIVGAEYVLGLLPRGTHDWSRFIRPAELAAHARKAGLAAVEMTGLVYNPLNRSYRLSRDTDVNYFAAFRKPGSDGERA